MGGGRAGTISGDLMRGFQNLEVTLIRMMQGPTPTSFPGRHDDRDPTRSLPVESVSRHMFETWSSKSGRVVISSFRPQKAEIP